MTKSTNIFPYLEIYSHNLKFVSVYTDFNYADKYDRVVNEKSFDF